MRYRFNEMLCAVAEPPILIREELDAWRKGNRRLMSANAQAEPMPEIARRLARSARRDGA